MLTDIFKDLEAYSTLWLLDFLETKDSKAWAIASKPADAFILFGAVIKNSGIKKKLSGIKSYIPFLNDPNLKNATEMAIASNLAGKAISISKTTVPHAASYPFTSLFNISHGHAVSLFFEKFFKFNYDKLNMSETSFDLKKRFDLIFNLFNVQNINDFNSKITLIKKQAKLVNDLKTLKIDIKKDSDEIIKGINLLRLGNNPVKILQKDIYKIMIDEKI